MWSCGSNCKSRQMQRHCPYILICFVFRYWISETYEARHAEGKEPESIDKEFLRLWFRERCDPYKDKVSKSYVADVNTVNEICITQQLDYTASCNTAYGTSAWHVVCAFVMHVTFAHHFI